MKGKICFSFEYNHFSEGRKNNERSNKDNFLTHKKFRVKKDDENFVFLTIENLHNFMRKRQDRNKCNDEQKIYSKVRTIVIFFFFNDAYFVIHMCILFCGRLNISNQLVHGFLRVVRELRSCKLGVDDGALRLDDDLEAATAGVVGGPGDLNAGDLGLEHGLDATEMRRIGSSRAKKNLKIFCNLCRHFILFL